MLAYLVISSGNSHLLSSDLETILYFSGITESSSSLSDSEEELDDWHREEDTSWFFPPSSLIFSFSPFMESLLPQGRDERSLVSLLLFCC